MGTTNIDALRAAYEKVADKLANKDNQDKCNGKVDSLFEKDVFKKLLEKQHDDGNLNNDQYLALMNVEFSFEKPAPETGVAPVVPATEATPEEKVNNETTTSEPDKASRKHVREFIKGYVDGRADVTVAKLVETLRNEITGDDYKAAIDQIEKALAGATFDSKSDIDKLEKTLKKALPNKTANAIVDLAKKEQIRKEKEVLIKIYDNVKATEKDYTKIIEAIEKEMDSREISGVSYYSKEAFKALEAHIADDVKRDSHKAMLNMKSEDFANKEEVTEKDVRKKLKANVSDDDKFSKETIDDMKAFAGVTARGINIAKTSEILKAVDMKTLEKELSTETLNFLKTNFLKDNGTGKYDLTKISNAIASAIGADNEMNYYEDLKASEIQEAINNVNGVLELKQPNGIGEKHLKELMKLCNIKKAPKDRSAKAVLGNVRDEAITAGIVAGALSTVSIKNIAVAEIPGQVLAIAKQTISGAPLGLAIGGASIALDALLKYIFGVEKGERTCFDYDAASGKTIQEYIDYLSRTEEDENKAKAIAVLAKLYENKYGENWNTEFVKDMKELAGNKTLNCLEFFYGKLKLEQNLAAEDTQPEKDSYYSISQKDAVDAVYEDVPAIDGGKTSWAKIASQYECLTKKYSLSDAIRILKITQAINDGDYSAERLDTLLKQSKHGRAAMRKVPGLDYDAYISALEATYLPNRKYDSSGNYIKGTGVKVPKDLAGCERNEELSLIVTQDMSGDEPIVAPKGHAADSKKVSDGSDAVYYAKFNNGDVKEYTSQEARQKAIDAFKKENPKAENRAWQ